MPRGSDRTQRQIPSHAKSFPRSPHRRSSRRARGEVCAVLLLCSRDENRRGRNWQCDNAAGIIERDAAGVAQGFGRSDPERDDKPSPCGSLAKRERLHSLFNDHGERGRRGRINLWREKFVLGSVPIGPGHAIEGVRVLDLARCGNRNAAPNRLRRGDNPRAEIQLTVFGPPAEPNCGTK